MLFFNVSNQPHTNTQTLIRAMEILSIDIQSEDCVANAAIAEAATRMKEMLFLLDDAYEYVEDYALNEKWKKQWLNRADKCGVTPTY